MVALNAKRDSLNRTSRTRSGASLGGTVLVLAGIALASGCAPTPDAGAWREPVAFDGGRGQPGVLVYGNLAGLLSHHDETPALDLFLYGPNTEERSLLRNPQGMTMLGDWLLVCDQGRPAIIGINLATGQSRTWSEQSRGPRCPVDLCTDGSQVYVADTTNRAVLVYGTNGRFVRELYPAGSAQPVAPTPNAVAPPVRRFRPASVRVREGVLYIGDLGGRCVARYDLSGSSWLSPILSPAGYPPIAAPTGLDFAPDGTLCVVDSLQQRVLRFAPDGTALLPIGAPGRGPGQLVRPKSVACTDAGLLFVTDAGRQSVLVFFQDGRLLTEIHEQAPWRGFTLPAGVLKLPPTQSLADAIAKRQWAATDEMIVVSDAMGGMPLILTGLVRVERGAAARAQ